MTELLLAIGLIAMAAVSLFRLPPFHPAQLWLVPWAITSTLYAFRFLPYNPLRPETAGLIAGAGLAFAACAWVAGRGRPAGHSDGTRGVDTRHFGVARRAALLLLGLTALWLTAYLVQVVAQYGLRAAFVSDPRVRTSVRLGEYAVTIKFVYAALAAAMACALVAAVSFTPAARRRWLMVTVLPICSVYFSTGRSNFVTGVAMAGLVYVVARPMRPSLRQAAAAGLAAAVLFVLTLFVGGAIIGKTYEASELATIDTVFSRTPELQPLALPYQYASAPIASLNELVASVGPWGATSGCATLAPGCRLFATVGLPLEAVPRIRGFTAPPLRWNTYTALDAPVLDAGAGLAVLLVAFLGALTGLAWRLARKGAPIFVVAFGILGTAAVSSVIQNNFLAYHYLGAILLFALAWLAGDRLMPWRSRRGRSDARLASPQ